MAASSFYQEIVDNGQAATGARLVHFAWFDPIADEVASGAMSGLDSPLLRHALEVVQRVLPNFDPRDVRFSATINPTIDRIYHGGEPVISTFDEIADGVAPR